MTLNLMFHFLYLFLLPAISAGLVSKQGCPDRCGNLSIPYPFGVGPSCSLNSKFMISCDSLSDPPKAYLSIINKRVFEINETYIRVEPLNMFSVCYEHDGNQIESYKDGLNLSGTPYTLSAYNMLTAIGCDDAVLQTNGSSTINGCSAFCPDKKDAGGFGYCPFNATSLGNGCCEAEIPLDTDTYRTTVGAQLIDLSRKVRGRKLFPCSYAFIQEAFIPNMTEFSYPLYYLDNSTALLNDNWASATRRPMARLNWVVGPKNCSRVKLDNDTYACRDEKSVCVDAYDDYQSRLGYQCSCVQGYEGNPYLPGGCKINVNNSWASATRLPMARLDWIVGPKNCSLAKLDNDTYACRDEKSVCVDDGYYSYQSRLGYQCSCVQGYEGNPYLRGGCKTIPRHGCLEQCGKLSIPFPFGVGLKCALEPSFEIVCNSSTNPPRAYLSVFKNAEIVGFSSSKVLVNYPSVGFACYNSSLYGGTINKTEDRSLVVDLSGTQFTLSDRNWITAIGVDDMVVGDMRHVNGSSIGSICAAVLRSNDLNDGYFYGYCPWGSSRYYPGNGCCRASIPRGTSYLEANLTGFSGGPRLNASCSLAFLQNVPNYQFNFEYGGRSYPIPNNSTEIPYLVWEVLGYLLETAISMDWRVGAVNCNQPRQNLACQNNSRCVNFDATVGGYLCNCSEGYHGNPYLTPGCQDIDECANTTTNACNSISRCINTPGSYYCLCPTGLIGDGKKDGGGCIPLSKSKTTILIGMGSGLGFLLLILMCIWVYKVLQKRREKMLKEKFFKRNGGLLLQQQTNEGALGQTKVFVAQELEVATDHFNENRILGQGGQGTVYKGMLSDGKIVAIKKSKLIDDKQVEPFINEVAILSHINHRNVVRLLGCCLETEVPLLVYEFMPNGTLYDLIHDPNNELPFPWNMRLKIATDIAGALAYLHSASSMPIYHRDIKSSNILLDEKYVVKMSDFGTSKSITADQTHLTTLVKGTFGYLDPEYFQSSQFTEKSDVYSFGVVLAELLTGQLPISSDRTEEERGLAARFRRCMEEECLETILDYQVLEGSKQEEVILVGRLAQRCLNMTGRMRPTMKEVANELENYRMSQTCNGVKDESEDVVRGFEDISPSISDSEYTWTGSYKSGAADVSPPNTHPLMFATC